MKYADSTDEILNSEIAALHSDIQDLRMAITSGEIKGSDGAARLEFEKNYGPTVKRLNVSTGAQINVV